MFKQTPKKRVLFVRRFIPTLLALFGVFCLAAASLNAPETAYATTSNTINFQARLQTSTGGIVPDGTYNITFKIYDASTSSGSSDTSCTSDAHCLWVESRTSGNKVTVTNGYFTVQLGSVTGFGSSIDWSQQLWLTMNIGGTGSASWDGEMDPRLPLTAVPYAFQAGRAANADQLTKTSSGNTSTLSIQSPTGGGQTFVLQDQGAGGTYNLLTQNQNDARYIQLQGSTPGTAQTGNFNISGTGIAATLQAGTFDTASSSALAIGNINANAINLGNTSSNITTTINGTAVVKPTSGHDSATAFTVKNASSATIFTVDTSGSNVILGNSSNPGSLVLYDSTGGQKATILVGDLAADRTITIPVATGSDTFCLQTLANCSSTLQSGYNSSGATDPQIQLSNTNGGLKIRDASSSSITNLLQIQNSTGGTTYFAVTATGASVTGTLQASTAVQTPSLDTATNVGLSVGTGNATGVTIGGTTNTTSVLVQGAAGATYTIGTSSNTGGITLGNSTATNTVNVGNATIAAGNTGTINIGTASTSTGKVNVTIGSTNAASTTTIQAGTGNLTLQTNSSSASIIAKSSTNGTAAFQVQNASAVSQLAVDTTNSRIILGTSGGDSTGTLLVLGSKTGSASDPTGTNGAMYYNATLAEFRCYENSVWRSCLANARTSYHYTNEMMSIDPDGTTHADWNGSGGVGMIHGEAGHPGIMLIGTGTDTASSGSPWATQAAVGQTDLLLGNGDYWRYETAMRISSTSGNALSNGTDRYTLQLGFADDIKTNLGNGCYFKYSDNVNSGKWQGTCHNGGTESTCDAATTVAINTWYRLTVAVNSAGTSADFQINGVSKCQITTNIPTTTGHTTIWTNTIIKNTGSSDRWMDVDYVDIQAQFGTSR